MKKVCLAFAVLAVVFAAVMYEAEANHRAEARRRYESKGWTGRPKSRRPPAGLAAGEWRKRKVTDTWSGEGRRMKKLPGGQNIDTWTFGGRRENGSPWQATVTIREGKKVRECI